MQPLTPSLLEQLRTDPALAKHLAREVDKERCRRSFSYFVRQAWRHVDQAEYVHGWYIDAICQHLEAVARGEIQRLLINIPPRHGKSVLISVLFPAWVWIQQRQPGNPNVGNGSRILATSYVAKLSTRDNVKCRRLIKSRWYQERWGDLVQVADDMDVKTQFALTAGGQRLSTSVKGFTTGEGAEIIIIDDPISTVESRSPVVRAERREWFTETMPSRFNDQKTGVAIMVMQRTHEEDPSEVAIRLGWTHLCLPAYFESDHPHRWAGDPRTEDGELLFPERFGPEEMDRLTGEMSEYAIAGQIQQRPAPRSGGMFKREWFRTVPAIPAGTVFVRAWDLASTEKSSRSGDPDYTASILLGRAPSGHFIIADAFRVQADEAGVDQAIRHLAAQDGRSVKIRLPQDPGSAGKSWANYLVKRLVGYNVRAERVTGKKEVRAEPVAAQARVGNVLLLRGEDDGWHHPLIEELCSFPNGRHDHWVDALSDAFDELVLKERGRVKTFTGAW